MWWLLLLVAQDAGGPAKRPPEVLALVDQARGLVPEFSADTLLKIAGSGLVREAAWKRELIEEAFRTGSHAQLPFPRRTGPYTDSRSSHEAWNHGLEALTLETRAVEAMIPLDPLRARTMYEEIVLPDLGNPTCRDALTPNVDAYYATAMKVFERGYTEKERQRGQPVHLLEGLVETMQAPEQVPPVSRLILNAHVSGDERKKLLGGFAVALDRVKGSDRVYARSEFELARMLAGVLRTGDNLGALVPAMRSYIVRQVSGARCAGTKSGAADSVRDFNLLMEQLNASGADYKKISPEEAKPSKDEEAYQDDQFWKSARSKQVLAALQWLNHGNRDLPEDRRYWTLEERSTMEWTVHYLDVLKLIEGWKPEEEPSPEDYYAMKSQVYLQLVQLVPPGKARDNALGNHRSFLEQSWFQIENHNFWFTDVALLLKDTRDREWRLSELSRSANPVIALYAQLEKLIPTK